MSLEERKKSEHFQEQQALHPCTKNLPAGHGHEQDDREYPNTKHYERVVEHGKQAETKRGA